MNKKLTSEDIKRIASDSIYIIVGAILMALGVGLFIKPFEIVTGGVSGVSIILASKLPSVMVGEVNMVMEICTFIITWALFLTGLFVLGKSFAAKTLLSSADFTLVLPVVTYFSESGAFNNYFNISDGWTVEAGGYALPILAAVFGGVFIGIGCAFTFRGGGSTGGLDVLAMIIVKYVKRLRSSVAVFCFDADLCLYGTLCR